MGIALLLHTHLRGMGLMRAVLIMPTTLAPVVAGFLFRYLLEPKGGLLPWALDAIGFPVPPQGFLGNANTALFSIGAVDTWQWTPFFAIVLYAGLLSINMTGALVMITWRAPFLAKSVKKLKRDGKNWNRWRLKFF